MLLYKICTLIRMFQSSFKRVFFNSLMDAKTFEYRRKVFTLNILVLNHSGYQYTYTIYTAMYKGVTYNIVFKKNVYYYLYIC